VTDSTEPPKATESLFPSREELLGGMPARRASTILFAIENLTLQLVARSRRALTRYQAATDPRDRERQFLDAVSGGREGQARPAIQDLERYANDWSYMVPQVPDIQAALLHLIGTRYPLDKARCSRIRAVLAADSAAVGAEYQRQQHRELAAVYAQSLSWRERLRWWRAGAAERIESMPPFAMAFSLTLTETVGAGMLALPIALAGVGVPVALLLIGVFGAISIVTVAALVEGITRDGTMRYGNGYFGQLVQNRLGRPGRVGIVVSMFAFDSVGLMVGMIGFGTMLSSQTGISPLIWVALLFAVALVVMRRESLNGTIAAALLIGIAMLVFAGAMIAIGLINVKPEYIFAGGAAESGGGWQSALALVFGVLMFVFFGHTSAANAARIVLRRDPSGRSLLWGNVAAMAVAALIYSLFIIAVNGSVPAERLAAEPGTAIAPLAEIAGPAVGVLGTVYVVLSLGLGVVFMSLGLYFQTREQIEARVTSTRWLKIGSSLTPIAIFVLIEAMLWLGVGSFTGPVSLIGALAVPLLAGVFPMLVVAAARRRGERVPATSLRLLGSWFLVALVIALYLGGMVVQALLIWTDPFERICGGLASVAIVVLIVVSVRRKSFAPRTVVELRADEPPGGGATVSVVAAGSAVSEERIPDLATAGEIKVELPADRPPGLYVWAHRPTREGDTQPLPVEVESEADGPGVGIRLAGG
jgi:amino acid permease